MKKKVGRKPSEISEADLIEIETLSSRGLLDKEIISAMGWSHDFFYKKKRLMAELSEAIKRGRANGHAEVANKLFESALSGNVSAMKYYLERRASWIVQKQVEANNDNPPSISVTFNVLPPKGEIKVTKGN